MKTFTGLLMLVFTSFVLLGQEVVIHLEIPERPNEQLIFHPTLDGVYFEASILLTQTDSEGKAKIQFSTAKPGFCYLNFNRGEYFQSWNMLQLYVYPDTDYIISLNDEQKDNRWKVAGKNEVENKFLLDRKRINLVQNQSRRELEYFMSDQDEEGWYQKVLSLREMELFELEALHRTGKVTKEFLYDTKADIHYYYASLIHELHSRTSLFKKQDDEHLNAMVSLMIENEIHSSDKYAMNGPSSMWYINYLRLRMLYYSTSNQKELALHYRNYQNYTEAYWNLLNEIFIDEEFENFVAHHIVDMHRHNGITLDVIQLYKRFLIEYPQSLFTQQLKKTIASEIEKMGSPQN